MLGAISAVASKSDSGMTLRKAASKHKIFVGTAVEPRFFEEPEYRQILGDEFSVIEPENGMKFASIHPRPDTGPNPYDFVGPDALVAFAKSHKIKVRGHTLVWHSQQPRWVTNGSLTPVELSSILRKHIQTVVGRYRKSIYAWDVVNEAFNDNGSLRSTVWFDHPGIGFEHQGTAYIEQAFRWAREADPRAKLFYNDYSAETIDPKSDAIFAMAQDFKKRHVPLDGIGLQMHCDLSFSRPEVLRSFEANMQRIADLGLDIHITELDIRLHDDTSASLSAQAELYSKIIQICRRQPRCTLIQFWGFTDKHTWIPGFYRGQGWPLLWDSQYVKKPAYESVLSNLK